MANCSRSYYDFNRRQGITLVASTLFPVLAFAVGFCRPAFLFLTVVPPLLLIAALQAASGGSADQLWTVVLKSASYSALLR